MRCACHLIRRSPADGVNGAADAAGSPHPGRSRVPAWVRHSTAVPGPHALPPDASDERLLRAFAAGEAAAFERLYARHHQALYRFVRRLLGRAGEPLADEVFQDAWMRLIEHAHTWQPQGASVRTWLFTLAHHRAIDVLRRSGRECSLTPEGADGDNGDAAAPPFEPAATAWADWPPADGADQAFWRAAGRRLLDCLEGLPLAQKTAFLLHHDDGLPLAEMAQALGVGFETAKTRLRYAMARLRTCMGAYLPAAAGGAAPGDAR